MAFSGGFTPRQFPIDPFDADKPSRLPWSMNASSLPDDVALAKQRNVLLILGEPPLDAIVPLLQSPNLAASLLILATSRAYSIPSSTSPAVRVLRLSVPLASSDSPASRLADVLQWANRTATDWRANPQPPAFEELPEEGPIPGYQTPPQRTSWFGTGTGSNSALPSPASSDLALSVSRKRAPPTRNIIAPETYWIPNQRIFDALFDFLPPDAPDRHLLKHAILVTTLARPFLATPEPAPPPPTPQRSSRRFSLRGRPAGRPATAAPSDPGVPPVAHIVHLIPPARATLIRPLESFCLSFSFPARGTVDAPRPYVMPPAALGDVLHAELRSWTLAELILCGALDGEPPSPSLRSLAKTHRAWIKGISDVTLTSTRSLPYALPDPKVRVPPNVQQPQPRLARPSNPQPFFAQELGLLPRPASQQLPPQPHITPAAAHPRVSMPPTSASLSRLPPISGPAPLPRRTNSAHLGPVAATPVPPRAMTMSRVRTTALTPGSDTGRSPASAKNVWPTPPSSPSSSSPSSSPELRDVCEEKTAGAGDGETTVVGKEAADDKGEKKGQDTESLPQHGTPQKRKLRGLFAWMAR